jgi:hypothetical protein
VKHPGVRWVIDSVRSSLLLVLLLLISAQASRAQDAGIAAFYRTGPLTTVDREKGAVNKYSTSGSGTSIEHVFGIGPAIDLPIGGALSLNSSLSVGLVNGSFVSDPYFASDSLDRRHFEVATSATLLEWAAAMQLRTGPLEFNLGPLWDLFLARSQTITQVIENSIRGEDTSSTTTSATVGRLALGFSAGYAIPILTRPTLAATVRYDPYVNRYRPIGDALQFGVRLTIPFRSHVEHRDTSLNANPSQARDVRDRNREATVTPPISLLVDGRDLLQDSTLPVGVTYSPRQMYEELPLAIPVDSLRLLNASEAATWTERAVGFGDDLRHDVLNVVASRCRSIPRSRLLLECDSYSWLKLSRYIRVTWKDSVSWLPSNRSRGWVRISASDAVTLLPLAKRVVERSVTVPRIVVERGMGTGGYELTIASGADTLLRKVETRSDNDNSITQLPATMKIDAPLSVHVASNAWSISRTLRLVPKTSDTAASQIEIILHQSHGDALVLTNRDALLRKIQAATSVKVSTSSRLDGEAATVLQRLRQPSDDNAAPGEEWTIRIEGTLPD